MRSRNLTLTATTFAFLGMLATAAHAQTESLNAPFTQADGGVTTNSYANTVLIHITGVGQSNATQLNDAFYIFTDNNGNPVSPVNSSSGYYQLGFSTTTLNPFDSGNAAALSVLGGIPAYSPTHDYTFLLNTGVTTPAQLHFGVTDGQFSDNSGSYNITVTAVPEPGVVATASVLALSGSGLLLRRRRARA